MNFWTMIWCGAMGVLVALLVIPLVQKHLRFLDRADLAQFHHTHRVSVSRLGGLVFVTAFILVWLVCGIFYPNSTLEPGVRQAIFFSSVAMFLLGFWDDIRPLGAKRKLLCQIFISVVACYCGIAIQTFKNPFNGVVYHLGMWGPVFTVAWLVTLTNLINLIDGIDGFAGGVALMLMGLLAYFSFKFGMVYPAMCAATMAGALLGFLRYNFPPAKIYMGDGGAYFLGFLIAALSAINSHKGTIIGALIAPLFVLALPIIDVSLAILRRGLKGMPIFRPDRKHIHHRLVNSGISRTRAVLALYLVSLVFLAMGLVVFWSEARWAPFLFGVACLILLLVARSFNFSREWFSVGRVLGNSLGMRKTTQYTLTLGHWLEMEAERCDSVENLWFDFNFVVKKLGFAQVTLVLPDGRKEWKLENGSGETAILRRRSHDVVAGETMRLEFAADENAMNSRIFDHLCEIAAEAWHRAALRWHKLNELRVRFDSRVKPQPPVASGQIQPAYVPLGFSGETPPN